TVQIEGPDSTQEVPVMDGNATSYEVSDLRPYTTYTFNVSAMSEAGAGPPISTFSTTPQGGRVLCWTPVLFSIE
ncbi:MAG: fibronectin type III domain-containing protein, partial [Proteobacteria bacterium]|nr:fibronectin type III domain-containing protein [Pseudomonadota bacterium]